MQVLLAKQVGLGFWNSHIILSVETVDDKDKLEGFCRLIGCQTITMPDVEIDGEVYSAVCDDEGLLVENPVPTLYLGDEQVLFGSIVFCRISEDGESVSLVHKDFERIGKFFQAQKPKMQAWKKAVLERKRAEIASMAD